MFAFIAEDMFSLGITKVKTYQRHKTKLNWIFVYLEILSRLNSTTKNKLIGEYCPELSMFCSSLGISLTGIGSLHPQSHSGLDTWSIEIVGLCIDYIRKAATSVWLHKESHCSFGLGSKIGGPVDFWTAMDGLIQNLETLIWY